MTISLFQKTDNAPLLVFRMLFGFLLVCESFGAIITGFVKQFFIDPKFTFSFIGFDWLQPLEGNGMYYYFALLGVLGVFIMLGWYYRLAMIAYTILWAGVYFMQKTNYNNHYYLLLLVSFAMIFFPANANYSIDAKRNPKIKSNYMHQWVAYFFIFQIAIVYFYAAVAKLYPDWLNGTFMDILYSRRYGNPYLKPVFSSHYFHLTMAYLGILFDFLIVPALWFKKTRNIAFLSAIGFHLFNAVTLSIGIFPFFALAFVLFFYEPATIRKLFFRNEIAYIANQKSTFSNKKIIRFCFYIYFAVQLLLPIRHYFIPDNVLWTEEGHRMSWRMMLRERKGSILIKIIDKDTKEEFYHNYQKDLTQRQIDNLATKPDYIWQYCQRIKKEYQQKNKNIAIYIDCKNAINKSEYQQLIDPKQDFAVANWNYFSHNDWILPYKK